MPSARIVVCLLTVSTSIAAPPVKTLTACKEGSSWRLIWVPKKQEAPCKGVVAAKGSFVEGLNVTGWGVLNVDAEKNASMEDQGYGAGLVEGYLTASHIYDMYVNTMAFTFGCTNISCVPPNVTAFMDQQEAWSATTAKAKKPPTRSGAASTC